jgi:hypothetical protein
VINKINIIARLRSGINRRPRTAQPQPRPRNVSKEQLTLVVYTAPRKGAHPLAGTLASIRAAGFTQHIHVFSDAYAVPDALKLYEPVTVHTYSGADIGCFKNWKRSTSWLMPNAPSSWYLFMQDDIEWRSDGYKKFKEIADDVDAGRSSISRGSLGLLSFYTSPAMVSERAVTNGWHDARYYGATRGFWGALAMCMPYEALAALVANPRIRKHKSPRQLDYIIGDAFRNHMKPPLAVKIHVPSLVEHTGELSTIFNKTALHPKLNALRHGYKYSKVSLC